MKFLGVFLIGITVMMNQNSIAQKKTFAIAIHGGAGVIDKSMPDSVKQKYFDGLEEAILLGQKLLKDGKTALDVVESVVKKLEDNPLFNAGKGAVFTAAGDHELDAAIMDGRNLSCGAVSGVKTVKNPIGLARLVMEKTPHVLLSGKGADDFAAEMKVEQVPMSYFFTERRFRQLMEEKKKTDTNSKPLTVPDQHGDSGKKGTVGCVVLDQFGNLAAATSTGGMTNKRAGRIGDSPIIGAGTYANNLTCAVSATGTGEQFIRHVVAFDISAQMEYLGISLQESVEKVIFKKLNSGDGGIIAVDKNGNISMVFNSPGMFRAAADSDGKFEVKIWE